MESARMMNIEDEFKRNPELNKSDLDTLREWIRKQPYLPEISDSELILFLHSNYYRMESTKKTIDKYYTMRTHLPEFFTNRDVLLSEGLQKALNVTLYTPLRGSTRQGYRVMYSRLLDTEPSNFVHADSVKGYLMVFDIWLRTEGTVPGHVIVVDMFGTRVGHVGRLNPTIAKKFLLYLQDALPVRLRELHVINASPIIDIVINMMKPFMKKELLDMLHIHTTMDTLEEFIPLEILPHEAGGNGGSVEEYVKNRMTLLERFREWFASDETHERVNEILRPEKSGIVDDIFSTVGSFKRLDVD